MSRVLNSFDFALIDDGTQITWNLASNGTVSQAWAGQAIPDFRVTQPTLYMIVRNAGVYVALDNVFKWFYDGVELQFDGDTSIAPYAGVFKKTTYMVGDIAMPALQIVQNLATANSASIVHMIDFQGTYTLQDESKFAIKDSFNIPITEAKDGYAYVGVIDGKTFLTEDEPNALMTASLWLPSGSQSDPTAFKTQWSLDGGQWTPDPNQTPHTYPVTRDMIEDKATLACRFWNANEQSFTGTPLATAIIDIDDQGDEYMLQLRSVQAKATEIQSADGYGTGDYAKLRSDDAVKIQFYAVPNEGDVSPSAAVAGFNYAYVRIYGYDNEINYTNDLPGFTNPWTTSGEENGWRRVTNINTTTHIAEQTLTAVVGKLLGGSGSLKFQLRTSKFPDDPTP